MSFPFKYSLNKVKNESETTKSLTDYIVSTVTTYLIIFQRLAGAYIFVEFIEILTKRN